ncbi:hypothetical protein [Sphingomonas sp. UYEF23]|uniref:hypothetical protein n=1 Tax=Sphingomonas sp. UYEF23 TaxID=1756408 RepID=UPI0033937798
MDTFLWMRTDEGSGFDCAPALYLGGNGKSAGADKPLTDVVVGFILKIRQALPTMGGTCASRSTRSSQAS